MDEAVGVVGCDDAGGDLHQCRLAGAVAADEADAVAGRYGQLRAFQQRGTAEGQVYVVEFQ